MSETKIMAVTGKPIFHSRSPEIFNHLFHELGIAAVYTRLSAENGEEAIWTAGAMKLSGFNVTSPFKEEIIRFLDGLDEHASAIGAVNCVVRRENKYYGYNTDYIGAVDALERNGINPRNQRVVVLGAGGAACAAAYGLIQKKAKKIILMNRTPERAKQASLRLGCDYAPLWKAEETVKQSDIFISCVSSANAVVEPACLKKDLVFMDASYGNSPLEVAAERKGCRVVSGLEWLLYQALPCFHLYTGQDVPKDVQQRLGKVLQEEQPQKKSHICLIGFMGSGKTTIGRLTAEKTGLAFVDTDTLIEKSAGETVREIFRGKGEDFFRDCEASILKRHLPVSARKVFSLGGGAVLGPENRKIIRRYCRTVWLWVSGGTALGRMDISSRPLLGEDFSQNGAMTILANRIPLYAKVSDLVISTESGDEEKIAWRIKDEVG